MILQSYPSDFSSIFADNYFRFGEADGVTSTEVSFHLADGSLLGARRYAGRTTIDASPSSLLRRAINPRPAVATKFALVRSVGRDVSVYASYNDASEQSPTICFTPSQRSLAAGEVMGGAEQRREIALGEWDEVAMVLEAASEVRVVATASDKTMKAILTRQVETKGVWNLMVAPEDVMEALGVDATIEWFSLSILIGGELSATVRYTLCERPRDAVRLAWLGEDGYICYHTFAAPTEVADGSLRTECDHPSGTTTLSSLGWSTLTLSSGYLSVAQHERLRGLPCSPRIWRVTGGGEFVPQRVVHSTVTADPASGYRLSLTLRNSQRKRYW